MGAIICFSKVKEFFEQLWILIAPAFNLLGWLFSRVELVVLKNIFYLLSDILLALGIIEFIKNKKIKNKNVISRAEKTTQLAFSPEEQAEEFMGTVSVYRRVVKVMLDNIKKFFKYVWGNKQSIISILTTLASLFVLCYTDVLIELLNIPVLANNPLLTKVICGIVVALFSINEIYMVVNKDGWENLSQMADRFQKKLAIKNSKPTKEEKAIYKDTLKRTLKVYDDIQLKIKSCKEIIANYKVLSSIPGNIIDSASTNKYSMAIDDLTKYSAQIEGLKAQIEVLKSKVK